MVFLQSQSGDPSGEHHYTCQVLIKWDHFGPHHNPKRGPVSLHFTLDRASVSLKCNAHNTEVAGLDWEPRADPDACALHCVSKGPAHTGLFTMSNPVWALLSTHNSTPCPSTPKDPSKIECQACKTESQPPGPGHLSLRLPPQDLAPLHPRAGSQPLLQATLRPSSLGPRHCSQARDRVANTRITNPSKPRVLMTISSK